MFQNGYKPGSIAGLLGAKSSSGDHSKLFSKPARDASEAVKEHQDRAKLLAAKLKAQKAEAKRKVEAKLSSKVKKNEKVKLLKDLAASAKSTAENSDEESEEEIPESTISKKKLHPERKLQREKRKKVKASVKDKNSRSVFVGNLPNTVKKQSVLKLFEQHGEVESIRLRSLAPANPKIPKKGIAALKQFHPMIHTLNAYVVFVNADDVEKALALNGSVLEDNHIRVDKVRQEKQQHDHKCSVFIGNLPFDGEEEDIHAIFSDCGTVENVRLIKDKFTRLGKGFGYVCFEDKDSVILALKMDGHQYKNRTLRVSRSTATPTAKADTHKKKERMKERSLKRKQTDSAVDGSPRKKKKNEAPRHVGKFTAEQAKMVGKKKEHAKKKLRHRIDRKKKEKLANILTGKKQSFKERKPKNSSEGIKQVGLKGRRPQNSSGGKKQIGWKGARPQKSSGGKKQLGWKGGKSKDASKGKKPKALKQKKPRHVPRNNTSSKGNFNDRKKTKK